MYVYVQRFHRHTLFSVLNSVAKGCTEKNAEEINVENKFKRQEETERERESREEFFSQNLREETTSERNSFESYRADLVAALSLCRI